jgi:hypothetical protein
MGDHAHWDDRYRSIGPASVSWYEDHLSTSLELIDALGITPNQSVIDVGGGASTLVDDLLERGFADLAVLDLSSVALDSARTRVRDPDRVSWIVADVATWTPPRTWDLWHDRAVLHFLVDEDARDAYRSTLMRSIGPSGAFVIGVFAEDGPTQCSALPVRRHSPSDLADLLDADVVVQRRHVHRTPSGAEQPFNWIAGRLRRSR